MTGKAHRAYGDSAVFHKTTIKLRSQPHVVLKVQSDIHVTPLRDGMVLGRACANSPANLFDVTAFDHHAAGISRQHARIYRDETGIFFVEDLDSTNGTYVNDVRVRPGEPRYIYNGDVLRLGDFAMEVTFKDDLW